MCEQMVQLALWRHQAEDNHDRHSAAPAWMKKGEVLRKQKPRETQAASPGHDIDEISNEILIWLCKETDEPYNLLFDLPFFDPSLIEILHKILLGDAKYTWYPARGSQGNEEPPGLFPAEYDLLLWHPSLPWFAKHSWIVQFHHPDVQDVQRPPGSKIGALIKSGKSRVSAAVPYRAEMHNSLTTGAGTPAAQCIVNSGVASGSRINTRTAPTAAPIPTPRPGPSIVPFTSPTASRAIIQSIRTPSIAHTTTTMPSVASTSTAVARNDTQSALLRPPSPMHVSTPYSGALPAPTVVVSMPASAPSPFAVTTPLSSSQTADEFLKFSDELSPGDGNESA
ncbi:hypothetical protein B0H14DRAFT_2584441 [Mycena olivaceomarginata]|nr:hypothetical protein B0H14DRAFT_2584441 [Mycena olivaceomarginata]